MARSGLQRTWVRIVLTVLTAAMMLLIFMFSTEPAEKSDQTSAVISRTVISLLYPDYENRSPQDRQRIYDSVQYSVRKAAHFAEYLILGTLLRLCLESWFGNCAFVGPVSWVAGTLYACTDELHQLGTAGRSGLWTDVMLDGCGVMAAVTAVTLIRMHQERKGSKKDVHEHRTCPAGDPTEYR